MSEAFARGGLAAALAAATLLAAPGSTWAQLRGDSAPLGRGAVSGAVCGLVRDYDDPVAQHRDSRVWAVRCEGWDAPIGRLYVVPVAADLRSWRAGLAGRATCQPARAETVAGLGQATRTDCRRTPGGSPYVVYEGRRGRWTLAAEGYAAAADVLETALRVGSGAARPPPSAAPQESAASAEIASTFGAAGGLSSEVGAASADVARLRARGYVQNNEWRFDQAEDQFRSLVDATRAANAPPAERAEALLNLALNVSNSGRFAEADLLFDQADQVVAESGDKVLAAEALNYRALHLRNQGRFTEAAKTAEAALQARAAARAALTADGLSTSTSFAITPALAAALNTRSQGEDLMGGEAVSPEKRLLIEDVQSYEVTGSSEAALGQFDKAEAALARAAAIQADAERQGTLNIRLRARVQADFGDLAMDRRRYAQAASFYDTALKILRIRHAGSSTEAGLLMDLGRAQLAAGQTDAALASYGRAFELFRQTRGSLGASADAAEPYFDLLLARWTRDPSHRQDDAARMFDAAESVVSEATAATVSRLAARVAAGDDVTAGLVRGVDDTRRQLNAAAGRIAALQAANAYSGAARAAADSDLKSQQAQLATLDSQLFAANPRYEQLVSSDAKLADLQKALRPQEVYVKIVLLADRGYGILVSPDAVTPYGVPLSRARAAAAAKALRAPFEAENTLPPFDVAASNRLYATLFGPVQDRLTAARHLVYEPDATLVAAPVAMLSTDPGDAARVRTVGEDQDYRGVHWLGARLDSSLVLSAASFLQSRAFRPSRAHRSYVGFGNPVLSPNDPNAFRSVLKRGGGDLNAAAVCASTRDALLALPALPETAGEIRTVGARLGAAPQDLVLGDRFTDAAIRDRKDLGDYRVVYFATHAILPMPEACLPEPALVTSATGPDSDGLLDAGDILDLKLDADLVVLSACDTGAGGKADEARTGLIGGGEALGGLTRAVIYAGARDMVVSHWEVDSAATERLMTGLFASRAPTTAEGLQQAQQALQQDPHLSHPYYWAPFTVVGDGARPLPAAASTVAAR